MANSGTEFSGKTVEEAVEAGLQQMGLGRDDAVIEIVNRGSRGILGFGSEPATVRIARRSFVEQAATTPETSEKDIPTDDETAAVVTAGEDSTEVTPSIDEDSVKAEAVASTEVGEDVSGDETESTGADEPTQENAKADTEESTTQDIGDQELARMTEAMLGELLNLMGFEVDIDASWQDGDETAAKPYLLLDIRGENIGALIGRRGETLSSIQYLLRLMVNQQVKQWKNIVVDVEHYKQRRVEQLTQLAERMARQVAESGRSVALEPMPANERRIIHLTLRDNPDVFTESTGDDDRRKVNIFPQR
jgi:spoIIIJ-associated protein